LKEREEQEGSKLINKLRKEGLVGKKAGSLVGSDSNVDEFMVKSADAVRISSQSVKTTQND
jgi:hypothetical protein